MITVTSCHVCGTPTAQLPDGSREFHYHPDPENPTSFKMCSTSNPMFFVWPWVKRMPCGICHSMVFVNADGYFNRHFTPARTLCPSSGHHTIHFSPIPEQPASLPQPRKELCADCNQLVMVKADGMLARHYPRPDQTYSADRYCGQSYPGYLMQTTYRYEPDPVHAGDGRR